MHFGSILGKKLASKNLQKPLGFCLFLIVWGVQVSVLGPMLASSWASLAHLEAMLGEMGAKIAPRGAKMNPRGAKIRQLNAKLEESCGQEAPKNTQEAHLGVMLRASWLMVDVGFKLGVFGSS